VGLFNSGSGFDEGILDILPTAPALFLLSTHRLD
jgi:hypothetical protein